MADFSTIEFIPDYIKKSLKSHGYHAPSLIQKLTLEATTSHSNIIGQSKNGTGKTLAFLLAIFSNIVPKPIPEEDQSCLECIILSPTRELAQQTYNIINDITAYANPPVRVIMTIGGQLWKGDIERLKTLKPQILVGTLGRVVHLIKEEIVGLQNMKELVVDEADQLFTDKSFKFDLHGLISLLPNECRKLVYSATYPKELLQELKGLLSDNIFIKSTDEIEEIKNEIIKESHHDIDEIQLKGIHQYYMIITKSPIFENKLKLLTEVLTTIKYKQCIIFFNQKLRGAEIANYLKSKKIQSVIIHGDQTMNERTQTLSKMRKFGINIVLSTDLVIFLLN